MTVQQCWLCQGSGKIRVPADWGSAYAYGDRVADLWHLVCQACDGTGTRDITA